MSISFHHLHRLRKPVHCSFFSLSIGVFFLKLKIMNLGSDGATHSWSCVSDTQTVFTDTLPKLI
jgi:hypothetical protein